MGFLSIPRKTRAFSLVLETAKAGVGDASSEVLSSPFWQMTSTLSALALSYRRCWSVPLDSALQEIVVAGWMNHRTIKAGKDHWDDLVQSSTHSSLGSHAETLLYLVSRHHFTLAWEEIKPLQISCKQSIIMVWLLCTTQNLDAKMGT